MRVYIYIYVYQLMIMLLEEQFCVVQFNQQDINPIKPASLGREMSPSLFCKTLRNSSALRVPSRFESNT